MCEQARSEGGGGGEMYGGMGWNVQSGLRSETFQRSRFIIHVGLIEMKSTSKLH